MSETALMSRRERLRAETLTEIKEHALAQLAEGGPDAVSLSAISRSMRMSGPALYRYFASREALLTTLVAESYNALADAMARASDEASDAGPAQRFRAVADAYRAWAVASPHRYQLIFASTYGSGLLDPDRTVPAAHRNMQVLVDAVRGIIGDEAASDDRASSTDQLREWVDTRPDLDEVPVAALHLAMRAWTRLHGVVSLELNGVFKSMAIDSGELFAAEVDEILARTDPATGLRPPT
jgi:AcrR family transcriptional regulator